MKRSNDLGTECRIFLSFRLWIPILFLYHSPEIVLYYFLYYFYIFLYHSHGYILYIIYYILYIIYYILYIIYYILYIIYYILFLYIYIFLENYNIPFLYIIPIFSQISWISWRAKELGGSSRLATYGSSQPPRDLSSGSVPEAPVWHVGSATMDGNAKSCSNLKPVVMTNVAIENDQL